MNKLLRIALSALFVAGLSTAAFADEANSTLMMGVYPSSTPSLAPGQHAPIPLNQQGQVQNAPTALIAPSPLPVTATTYSYTKYAGTITTGGTSQPWIPAGGIKHGCAFQNQSTASLYLELTGSAASATSLSVAPNGGYYECTNSGAPAGGITVFGATTGQQYYGVAW